MRRTAPSRGRGRRAGLRPWPATATAGGTGWRSCPGSGWTTSGRASPTSPASPSPRPGRSPPPAAACGSGRSTCPTAGRRTTRTTRTSWPGWRRCATRWPPSCDGDLPLAVCGDFNVAPTDADVWDPALFTDSTHVTPAERAALARAARPRPERRRAHPDEGPAPLHLLGLPGRDVPPEQGHADRPGVRHRRLRPAVRAAYVDREARKGKGPSDHAPIVVDAGPGPGGRGAAAAARLATWQS